MSKIKDPKIQSLVASGLHDGDLNDDKVTVREINIPVSNLYPTQKEIGLADSLGWVSENNPDGGAKLASGKQGIVANVGGRIITANGIYILDGHHRWSQVSLLNPDAQIPAFDLSFPASAISGESTTGTGVDFLKNLQIAIAAVDRKVPQVNADTETDVYRTKGDRSKIENIIKTVIPKRGAFATKLSEKLKSSGKLGGMNLTESFLFENVEDKLKIINDRK